jgi:hypothetical protein|eukprot:Transcript_10998.p2 GENE.Transcript_10998~~Transcript_10998.p2  ORF type:complete len:163 (-),score=60.50 Transcript_10998:262-750(-)
MTAVCYLTFTDSSQGSLFTHWSTEPVEGALASYVPAKAPPAFKLKQNGGRQELVRECGGPKIATFYQGYCQYLKAAGAAGGPFTVLEADGHGHPGLPTVAVYMLDAAETITRCEAGKEYSLDGMKALAVQPAAAMDLEGVQKTLLAVFMQTASKAGAAIALQ